VLDIKVFTQQILQELGSPLPGPTGSMCGAGRAGPYGRPRNPPRMTGVYLRTPLYSSICVVRSIG
jgi:hypothetical protein